MAGSASRVVFALDAAGLSDDVAFVSDGQLSGLCLKGLTVAEVSPESAVGGPLVARRERRSHHDRCRRTCAQSGRRRVRARGPAGQTRRAGAAEVDGYLSIYQRSVQPMSTGAVLVKKD